MPRPPLTQRVARPFFDLRRCISCTSVVTMRAPLHPMGRLGQAIEIARAALFLASDDQAATGDDPAAPFVVHLLEFGEAPGVAVEFEKRAADAFV